VFFFFGNPTNKTEIGKPHIHGGTTNSKPPGPMIVIDQLRKNTEQQSGAIYYTLFERCATVLRLLLATASKLHEFGAEKPIFPEQLNRHILTFPQ
jgi:hypothetical protein